jgi:hypothetical protein
MKNKPIRARVTTNDIRAGIAGDCHSCPGALALSRATKDTEPRISERGYDGLFVCVWGQWLEAPWELREFVRAFDALERGEDGKPTLPAKLDGDLAPFSFELPPLGSPPWKEECYCCENLFDPGELDDEGYCPDCVTKHMEPAGSRT